MLQNSECEARSLARDSLDPFVNALKHNSAHLHASYVITPDGASTSRTSSKAPHDSAYLLNTEYNVSLAYVRARARARLTLKETYPEGPFTMPRMVETREFVSRNEAQLSTRRLSRI